MKTLIKEFEEENQELKDSLSKILTEKECLIEKLSKLTPKRQKEKRKPIQRSDKTISAKDNYKSSQKARFISSYRNPAIPKDYDLHSHPYDIPSDDPLEYFARHSSDSPTINEVWKQGAGKKNQQS